MNYSIQVTIAAVLVFTFSHPPVKAQIPEHVIKVIEELSEEQLETTDQEFLVEHFSSLLENPVNLNSADKETLEASMLFSPFQIFQILSFREKYGDYFSTYELISIPGFSTNKHNEIIPFITIHKSTSNSRKPHLKVLFMTDLRFRIPLSAGYIADTISGKKVYAGSPFQLNTRVKVDPGDRIHIGLTFSKDPGETLLHNRLPQFLSGYIEFNGDKLVRQIIAGSFKLHSGLGLVTGSGFNQSISSLNLQTINMCQLRPYAPVSENRNLNGIAINLKLRKTESVLWVSHNRYDISLNSYNSSDMSSGWESLFRKGGNRRTKTEIEGAGLAFRQSSGMIMNRKFERLILGVTLLMDRSGLTVRGADSLSLTPPSSYLSQKAGTSLMWFNSRSEIFLEMALSSNNEFAILGGAKYRFNDFLNVTAIYRYYSRNYIGFDPSAWSMNSKLQNETGPGLHLNLNPFRNTTINYALEYARFPWIKYQVDAPSAAYISKFEFKYVASSTTFVIILSSRQWMKNVPDPDRRITPLQILKRERIRMQLSAQLSESVKWNSRLDISRLNSNPEGDYGFLMYHEISGEILNRVKIKCRYLLFENKTWDNRIYCYEPGLVYSYNFPSFYGKGSKLTGILQIKPLSQISLGIKGNLLIYSDRNEIGTGNEMVEGNRRWDVGVQAIWRISNIEHRIMNTE